MQRFLLAALVLLTAGCLPPRAEQQTRCGTWTNEPLEPLQAAEDRLLAAFSPHVGDVCPKLDSWYLRVNPASDGSGWYSERHGFRVAGLTWCEYATIDVANWDFEWNAYAHEVIHLLDCGGPPNAQHEGWDEWQWAAIARAQRPSAAEQVSPKGSAPSSP